MPNTALTEALKEAYALAPSDEVPLETLQFSHPALPGGDIFIVNDTQDGTFTLEDGETVQVFEACGFSMARPSAGDNGLQTLPISIDNVGRVLSDFIAKIRNSKDKVTVTFRPYLADVPTVCQQNPPLRLWLTDITVTETQVQGNCIFLDVINMPFPTDTYTRDRFPGLAN